MITWFRQYLTISRNAFTVWLSDPLVLIMNLFILAISLLLACMPGFTFGEQISLVRDQALSFLFISTTITLILGLTKVITEDLKGGMISIIMTRPTMPSAYILGKWSGVTAVSALLLFSGTIAYLWCSSLFTDPTGKGNFLYSTGIILYIATILVIMIGMGVKHYLFKGRFVWECNISLTLFFTLIFIVYAILLSNTSNPELQSIKFDLHGALAFAVLLLPIITFAGIITFIAIIADHTLIMVIGIIVFLFGLLSAYFVTFVPSISIQHILLSILPNWQLYWISNNITEHTLPSLNYIISITIHAIGQSLFWLTLGYIQFQRKELLGSYQ